MKKICWWMGTDALILVKNPPGHWLWHVKLFFYRIKWRLIMNFFDEHWVDEVHLGEYLKKYGVKNFTIKHDEPFYGKVKKKKHEGFNILYYCPAKPVNLGGMKYIRWLYGYDIYQELKKHIDANFICVDGTYDMNKIYPIIDLYIRPNRHDGHCRMITECTINNIPVIRTRSNPNIEYFINEITDIKNNNALL